MEGESYNITNDAMQVKLQFLHHNDQIIISLQNHQTYSYTKQTHRAVVSRRWQKKNKTSDIILLLGNPSRGRLPNDIRKAFGQQGKEKIGMVSAQEK